MIRDNKVYIDGEVLDEPYLRLDGGSPHDDGPEVVPPDCYFLLGDRRNRSKDSRFAKVGFVPRHEIFGRAKATFFSVDPRTGELRCERFGRVIH